MNQILISRDPVSITTIEDHYPEDFYLTGDGLYVWCDMRKLVVVRAKPMQAGTTFSLGIADLAKDATDKKIEAALSGNLFDESAMCAVIAQLIGQQPGGKKGTLLSNGYANLFYTSSCLVTVHWDDVYSGEWRVITWQRGDRRRRAFPQVLSLAKQSL